MSNAVERAIPIGTSLTSDAPGWSDVNTRRHGPICWKCRGVGERPFRPHQMCTVCNGKGWLPARFCAVVDNSHGLWGVIRKARPNPIGWQPFGPMASALQRKNCAVAALVRRADRGANVHVAKETIVPNLDKSELPPWLPRHDEHLVKLIGHWRILQRVGSHRWTTDDLCTASVATRQIPHVSSSTGRTSPTKIRYLDLGCGNASVLQMVCWALLKEQQLEQAIGIEARQEAVGLARRSLRFNIGNSTVASIIHGDFRDSSTLAPHDEFDLITGTPPYFRVDFHLADPIGGAVEKAIIREGGMPTALQSAPARCEFRGGIEAYCEAARRWLGLTGRFVVCENWMNHDRVVSACKLHSLRILHRLDVEGRIGRGTLFCVYVIGKCAASHAKLATNGVVQSLTVRDNKNNWTDSYLATVFDTMSVPRPCCS